MKTSVKTIMMSFALMGCLIFSASDASAQGRGRSQGGSTSRSQSAAVSRSNNNSTAPTVSRNSSSNMSRSSATPQVSHSSSSSSRSSATPQVSRSNSSSSSSMSRGSATTPKVDRSSSASKSSAATPQVTRSNSSSSRSNNSTTTMNRGATTRGGNDKGSTTAPSTTTRRSDNATTNLNKPTTKSDNSTVGSTIKDTRTSSTRPSGKDKPNGGKDKPNGGMDKPDGNKGGMDKPNGNRGDKGGMDKPNGNRGDKGGMDKPNGNRGGKDKPNGNRSGDRDGKRHDDGGNKHHGYSPKNRYDYNDHHYRSEFSWNYTHHNWSRPLPPPARAYRHAPWVWYRPTIPAGWHPYAGAPVIDRILGLVFGSLYETSLDYLYNSGYYIDGYADGIIYLRDVPLLNLYWSDVMLNYEYNRLVNAQFVYHSSTYNTSRFNRVYNSLSRIYGSPVYRDGMTVSWYGGNSQGYVTLSMVEDYGDYYTTISIGY